MGVQITADELVTGAIDFLGDCIKNKRAPGTQLEYSNGETAASFEYVIYLDRLKSDLYWSCLIQIMKNQDRYPVSENYICGYNAKATELGMPLYNQMGDVLKLISILAILYKIRARSSDL